MSDGWFASAYSSAAQRRRLEQIVRKDAPETIQVDGAWYDRRDTVDALTGLLAEARKKIETYKGVIREYRQKELAEHPTPPPKSAGRS